MRRKDFLKNNVSSSVDNYTSCTNPQFWVGDLSLPWGSRWPWQPRSSPVTQLAAFAMRGITFSHPQMHINRLCWWQRQTKWLIRMYETRLQSDVILFISGAQALYLVGDQAGKSRGLSHSIFLDWSSGWALWRSLLGWVTSNRPPSGTCDWKSKFRAMTSSVRAAEF